MSSAAPAASASSSSAAAGPPAAGSADASKDDTGRSRRSSRSRSRSRDRHSRRHRHRHSRSGSRTPSPSRSRSPRRKHRRRTRSRSRSESPARRKSRSPRRERRRERRSSRSRSASARRKSRSRERRERRAAIAPEAAAGTAAAPGGMSAPAGGGSRWNDQRNDDRRGGGNYPSQSNSYSDSHRRPHVVPRDQHQPSYPAHGGGGGYNNNGYSSHQSNHGGNNSNSWRPSHHHSAHDSRSSDPLTHRPPAPPASRPESLLSHVLPKAKGRYAYVMLVMKGDSYACGAIIAAYSLRLNGTKHSLVCMVTPDVTEACRKRMLYVFNEVVEVPYVQYSVKPLRTQKQRGMYNAWVDVAFTKWNMLSLTQYEKCLFVDADKLSTGNMDHLFEEMSTPAGTFSSPWSEPFVERKAAIAARTAASGAAGAGAGGNNRRHYANAKGMYNPYMQNTHNSRVTSSQVYSALTEQSFVVIGTVVLLSPNAEDYAQYRAMLEKLVPFGFSDCHSMMDEQSLSFYFGIYKNQLIQNGEYGKLTGGKQVKIVSTPVCDGAIDAGAVAAAPSAAAVSSSTDASTPSFIAPALPSSAYSEWSYIHHAYNYVPWHRYWLQEDEVPYVFHFFNLKPWVLDRNAWLDLEAWWELVLAMLQDETLPAEAREDLRTIYPAAMLALPKNEGCCWCRLSEESFFLPQDGAWKKHNVFDGKGQLQCPQMKAGLERNAKKRLLEAAAKKE